MTQPEVKQRVREFYDQVGWQMESEGFYQNARYEDLRPVSREYIHRCHLRVNRHLRPEGRFLLDAGSGPVQYPEYLTYSQGYQYRVCADISIVALQEARKRLGQRGLFVVADVANLPFKPEVFDGVVSLHTLHHLPLSEQKKAYRELIRVLGKARSAVVVNGWTVAPLMDHLQPLVRLMERVGIAISRLRGRAPKSAKTGQVKAAKPTGTFVEKLDADWLHKELDGEIPFEIRVWRSVSVRFLRAVIHAPLAGRWLLKLLYWLEERNPAYFGKQGQYPLIVLRKA